MTGKDLIIYILDHDLIDSDLTSLLTKEWLTPEQYAVKRAIGSASLKALIDQGKFYVIKINDKCYISEKEN